MKPKNTHSLFEFLDDLLASLEGLSLGLVQSDLHVLDLAFQTLAELLNLSTTQSPHVKFRNIKRTEIITGKSAAC